MLISIFVFHIFVHKSSATIKDQTFAVTVLPSGDYTVRTSSCVMWVVWLFHDVTDVLQIFLLTLRDCVSEIANEKTVGIAVSWTSQSQWHCMCLHITTKWLCINIPSILKI